MGNKDSKQDRSGNMPSEKVESASMSVREVSGERPLRCDFPGPRGAQSPLRVAVDRGAQAEVIAHARESLNAEICGVLAGRVCEDDEGVFVHVQAAIRGAAATESSRQVTFTQATWTSIHQTLERQYPKLKIVGWYHSHPGFGVEFSDMDLFIQRNFFPSPTQIALVTDPLSGAVAVCVNTAKGIEYLPRFWIDGREQECRMPKAAVPEAPTTANAGGAHAQNRFQEMEARVGQLVQTVDDLRTTLHRFLLFAAVLVCVGVLAVAGYGIHLQLKARIDPPQNVAFAPVQVKIGDQTALLGVGIVSWELPPELDAVEQAMEKLRRELEKANNTNAASFTSTNVSAKPKS